MDFLKNCFLIFGLFRLNIKKAENLFVDLKKTEQILDLNKLVLLLSLFILNTVFLHAVLTFPRFSDSLLMIKGEFLYCGTVTLNV